MNIRSINGLNKSNLCHFKGKDDSKENFSNESLPNDAIVVINPFLMKAMANVKPYCILRDEEGRKYIKTWNFEIDPDFTSSFLSKQNGEVDYTLVNSFIRIYSSVLEEMNNEEKEFISSLKRVVEEADEGKIRGDEKVSDIITQIAKNMLEEDRSNPTRFNNEAYRKTRVLFMLSKTPDGYDFSDMDKKNKLNDLLEELKDNVSGINPEYILYLIKNEDETYDVDFGIDFLKVYNRLGTSYSPKVVAKNLKSWIDRAPQDKDEIIKTVQKLQKSDFGWFALEPRNCLAELMECLFDEYDNFDVQKRDNLLDDVSYAGEVIGNEIEEMGFNGYEGYVRFEFERLMEIYRN